MTDWKVDESERRYRELSPGHIEYAPEYIFSGETKPKIKEPENTTSRICPFEETAYKRHECRGDACAWWQDGDCVIVTGSKTGTLGASCPLSQSGRQCVRECKMYGNDGYCAVTRRFFKDGI